MTAGPTQELVLHNTHQVQGDPDNLWKVQFAADSLHESMKRFRDNPSGPAIRVMYVLLTPDKEGGDLFKMIDRITEAGLNPGLPKVYVQATTVTAMQTSADRWMLDSPDTLHERPGFTKGQ